MAFHLLALSILKSLNQFSSCGANNYQDFRIHVNKACMRRKTTAEISISKRGKTSEQKQIAFHYGSMINGREEQTAEMFCVFCRWIKFTKSS
jgi:hypothetical protein